MSQATVHSFGVLLVKDQSVLVCKRRNSIEFIEIVLGNYDSTEILQEYMNLITKTERDDICSKQFCELWHGLWKQDSERTRRERYFYKSRQKFFDNQVIQLAMSTDRRNLFRETEFTFPKGRKKNKKESEKHCAQREFCEETGISKKDIVFTSTWFIEFFFGTNGKKYSTKYFVARYLGEPISMSFSDNTEVSGTRFVPVQRLPRYFRHYRENSLYICHLLKEMKQVF